MRIEFKRLTEVERTDIIELMNHPRLRQHMPLLGDTLKKHLEQAGVPLPDHRIDLIGEFLNALLIVRSVNLMKVAKVMAKHSCRCVPMCAPPSWKLKC